MASLTDSKTEEEIREDERQKIASHIRFLSKQKTITRFTPSTRGRGLGSTKTEITINSILDRNHHNPAYRR